MRNSRMFVALTLVPALGALGCGAETIKEKGTQAKKAAKLCKGREGFMDLTRKGATVTVLCGDGTQKKFAVGK